MVTHKVQKVLAELSSTDKSAKRLTLTSWNGSPEKLDLRIWLNEDGEERPAKGMTLSDEEATTLYLALTQYLSEKYPEE